MKILIHSASGDSGGLAWIMKNEGAEVSIFIKDTFARKVGEGLYHHVDSLEEGLKAKPDVILFDLNGEGEIAEKLRKDGFKVVGGSQLADKLEMDRAYGVNLAKQFGIKTPKTVEFKKIDEAIGYIKGNNKPLAIKLKNWEASAKSGKNILMNLKIEILRKALLPGMQIG